MTKRLYHCIVVIALATACLYAGPPITAEIPFSFHVGDSSFPAGSYTASTNIGSSAAMVLRSLDGKSSVMALSNGVQSKRRTEPVLVFNRYGDEYFLFQVWTGPGETGRQLVPSRHEAELAAAAKRNVQVVVAKR